MKKPVSIGIIVRSQKAYLPTRCFEERHKLYFSCEPVLVVDLIFDALVEAIRKKLEEGNPLIEVPNPHHHQDDRDVPAGVGVAQGVVVDIGIPVERLGVPWLGHDGIGLQEAAQGGVVEAGLVIVEPEGRLPPLAGEAAVGEEEAALPSNDIAGKAAKELQARLCRC